MGSPKDDVNSLLQKLPDDASFEDIQYHLYVRQKVERGMQAIEDGRVVPQDEAERRVAEWARSATVAR